MRYRVEQILDVYYIWDTEEHHYVRIPNSDAIYEFVTLYVANAFCTYCNSPEFN